MGSSLDRVGGLIDLPAFFDLLRWCCRAVDVGGGLDGWAGFERDVRGGVGTGGGAPVIVASRLRKGSAGSARGAGRIVADALRTVRPLRSAGAAGTVLLRADSAYYGCPTVPAASKSLGSQPHG